MNQLFMLPFFGELFALVAFFSFLLLLLFVLLLLSYNGETVVVMVAVLISSAVDTTYQRVIDLHG